MRDRVSNRRLFILPHEAAVAIYVGAEYGGELAFQYSLPMRNTHARYGAVSIACDRNPAATPAFAVVRAHNEPRREA